MTEAYRPRALTKYRVLGFKRAYGGVPKKNSPYFWVARGGKQNSDPLGNILSFIFCARDFRTGFTYSWVGLNFDICRGHREPAPKVDQIFPKIFSSTIWKLLPLKPEPRQTWCTSYVDKLSSVSKETSDWNALCRGGWTSAPQTWLPLSRKICKFFAAAGDPLAVPVRKMCIWHNF